MCAAPHFWNQAVDQPLQRFAGMIKASLGIHRLVLPAYLIPGQDDCRVELDLISVAAVLLAVAVMYAFIRATSNKVYLLDFACYKPPSSQQVTISQCLWGLKAFGKYENKRNGYEEEIAFQKRIQHNNGVSEKTYGPVSFFQPQPILTLERAREESKLCMMGAVREVMAKTGLKPRDVDFLIVNCSLFNPTPSLSAMIINHFKFKSTIISYNLSGMGCSAGIISVDLARQMLELTPNKYALVVSTENITLNWYKGSQRSFLIPNTLFRIGASAAVMTNKRSDLYRCKYQLQNVVRVNLAAENDAYQCVFQKADKEGILGVTLNKDIVKVAAKALEQNLTRLGPQVLPYREQILFAYDFALRKTGYRSSKPYQPKFRKAFDHFCLHAGGRGVIEGLGGELGLSKRQLEPSFGALYFYGNTSSSSYWYSFGFAESKHGVRKGDRVWQVGFGSGFKSNSAVWKALRTFKDTSHKAWADVSVGDIATMWEDFERFGVDFVDGIMPPYELKKKPATPAAAPPPSQPTPEASPEAIPGVGNEHGGGFNGNGQRFEVNSGNEPARPAEGKSSESANANNVAEEDKIVANRSANNENLEEDKVAANGSISVDDVEEKDKAVANSMQSDSAKSAEEEPTQANGHLENGNDRVHAELTSKSLTPAALAGEVCWI